MHYKYLNNYVRTCQIFGSVLLASRRGFLSLPRPAMNLFIAIKMVSQPCRNAMRKICFYTLFIQGDMLVKLGKIDDVTDEVSVKNIKDSTKQIQGDF